MTSAFSVLYLNDAFVVHRLKFFNEEVGNAILALHGLIFCFICDDIQRGIFHSFMFDSVFGHDARTPLSEFLSNSQRSQHHAVDNKMHNSVTERCFSYILNRRLAHFPGTHPWESKTTRRPWLWRWRNPKGVITNVNSQLGWRQGEYIGCSKKLEPFWALVAALKYLPYLLNKATRSEVLIALAKMWSYRPSLLASLLPYDTKKAGKAVKRYLSRFDEKEQYEGIAVGPPLLCIV